MTTLPPVPRELSGSTAALFERVVYRPGELMDTTSKQAGAAGLIDVLLILCFSLITIGILPAVIWSVYRNRKRRLKPFFIHGLPATARVLDMGETDIGFGNKLKRVRYEFEADGHRQRGSDDVLPFIADLWEPGDPIPHPLPARPRLRQRDHRDVLRRLSGGQSTMPSLRIHALVAKKSRIMAA